MAANLFLHHGIFSLVFSCAVLASEVFSSDGVCTRLEEVSKTRPRTYRKTYMETYYDWCYYSRYRYDSYRCQKQKLSEQWVTEQESYTELETKQFCCTGYKDARIGGAPLECTPVCDFICLNGKCTRPNYCECDSGYSKKPGTENICEPVCSHQCIHGYCSKPELCSCDFGYAHKSDSSQYVCQPVCTNHCVNANCTSPDICTCLQGFAATLQEPHRCHAVCALPCHNGVCTSPDECTCFKGYKKDNSIWNVCDPVCPAGCINGECTAPGECTCFGGFEKTGESSCEPKCKQECLNGRCTEPEICSCLPGYQSFIDDPYSCFPVCSPGCANGNCTEPDKCECFPGFEESDDPSVCRPYCSDGCENGICSQPEECTCLWGFKGEGNSSICTQREEENMDCSFLNEIINHDFDKHCFKITNELSLKNLGNCNIFQYLASYNEQIGIDKLHFYCEGMTNLEQSENRFQLRLECIAKQNTIEGNLSSEELSSTSMTGFTEEQDSTGSFESTTELSSSWETSTMTEDPVMTETSEMQNTPDNSQIYTTLENDQDRGEFSIISVGISSKTKLSELPLNLNITLKFLPLITRSQMTEDYFDNITSVKREWCLCHGNQKNWSICASSPVQLYLCACEPRTAQVLLEESRIASSLKIVTKIALSMAALLIVYLLYNMYQSGSYEANQAADSTTGRPILSLDLISLDGSTAEEDT